MEENTEQQFVTPESLKKVWAVEKDLLVKLLDVCRQKNLTCWVDGGTMLGTVRHHGFIPWDDDIDVIMPRKDYDILLHECNECFSHPYFLQSAYSDVDYYRGHAQLRNSDTCAIRPSDSYQPFNQGIFIDICPLDGAPDDEAFRKEVIRKTSKTLKFLKAKNTNILISGRLGLVFRKIKSRYVVSRRGWVTIYKEMEDMLRDAASTHRCTQVAQMSFSGDDLMMDRDIFGDTVWMDFEDIKVPVPVGYDRFLTKQYGDYMTPVKEKSYHGTVVFDTEHSYKEILPRVRRDYRNSLFRRFMGKIHPTE
jgi:lipopolysaccharide cholinephosphotransferase